MSANYRATPTSATQPQQTPSQQNIKYKVSFWQRLFAKEKKVKDIFADNDYVKSDNQTDVFAFGADDFNIKEIYHYYYSKQQRYPIQAFLDLYFHDALQEYVKTKEEHDRLSLKTKKVAQLSQKLYNLTLLEERLMARKKLLEKEPEV